MQYSPKLKRVAEQIKELLKKEQINGTVFLHEPGFSEFVNIIDAPYGCAFFDHLPGGVTGIRFRAKASDYPGGAQERNQKIANTENFLDHLIRFHGNEFMMFDAAQKLLEGHIGKPDHTQGSSSDEKSQNN